MNETTPTMTELKTLVDHASAQSDRWLFIALLIIGIIVVWGLFKYFTAQIAEGRGAQDKLGLKLDELNKFVRDEHSQLVGKCTDALNANTRVIERLGRGSAAEPERRP